MQTRAKFKCTSVTKRKPWSGVHPFEYTAEFDVVTSGSEENKKFFASTPGGSIKLSQYREDQFTPGAEYYVDFTQVESAT